MRPPTSAARTPRRRSPAAGVRQPSAVDRSLRVSRPRRPAHRPPARWRRRLPARRPSAAARAQLVVERRDAGHQVPMCPAEADHRDRRDHVQDELLGRARLQSRRSCDHLGADRDAHLVVDDRGELGPVTQTMQPVSAPRERADSSAATTKGERPLALMPTTASPAPTPAVSTAAEPAAASSSSASSSRRRGARVTSIRTSARTRRRRAPRGGRTSLPRRRRGGHRPGAARRCRRRAARSTRDAPATDGATVASPAFMSSTSSSVVRRSRSAPAASRASVPSSSKAVMVSQCMQTIGDWSIPFSSSSCGEVRSQRRDRRDVVLTTAADRVRCTSP